MAACIYVLCPLADSLFKTQQPLDERLTPVIPHLGPWIILSLKHVLGTETTEFDEYFLEPVSLAVRLVFLCIHETPGCDEHLKKEPALRMIIRVWLRKTALKAMRFASLIFFKGFLGHTCEEHSATSLSGKRLVLLGVALELGLQAEDVVELALCRVLDDEDHALVHMKAILALVMPPPSIAPTETPVLQQAFLTQAGVELVLKTAGKVFHDNNINIGSTSASNLTEEASEIISVGLVISHSTLHCVPGFVPLRKALQTGLFILLALSSTSCVLSCLGSDAEHSIRSMLATSLLVSLTVRKCSLSIQKAFGKCRLLKPFTKEGVVPFHFADMKIRGAWQTLYNSIQHYSRSHKAFSYERQCEVSCENVSYQVLRGVRYVLKPFIVATGELFAARNSFELSEMFGMRSIVLLFAIMSKGLLERTWL